MNRGAGDDRELLAAVGGGEEPALRTLYDRHAPWLILRLARRCSDRDVVDEVVQDTFVAIWRKPGAYDGRGEVGAWIWGIGIRRLIDALRRRRRPEPVVADPRPPQPSAEDEVLRMEVGEIGAAVQRLPADLRAVVQATVLDGLTSREAGLLLRIPAGTVKTRMMRARAQLHRERA